MNARLNPEAPAMSEARRDMLNRLRRRKPATALERDFYTKPADYQIDMELIWYRDWLFVGHDCEVLTAGQYLTVMGYGINAATYNANPATYGTLATKPPALAQSGSLTGQGYTPIARVVALIDPNGNVNSTTGVFNVFNQNNPRSIYTADGLNAYISGQGAGSDSTGGTFYSPLGAINNSPIPFTGLDTSTYTYSQETRTVQIYNGTLYVSVDTKEGSNNARSFIGTLGTPPATSLFAPVAGHPGGGAGPTQLASSSNANTTQLSSTSKLTLTASETNGINSTGQQINLSPSGFYFANAYTMYVADTGNPKQNSATSLLGDGGPTARVHGNWCTRSLPV